ncbi:hypothetical protein I4U23_027921 [Adineta vaga]|nr:hypothetical protein I4U23_027921 [Adineta vaga]
MDIDKEISNTCWWTKKSKFLSKLILSYYFYIHIILFIPLAIIQLRFSSVYQDHCTIDDRLILYLFVIGIIQLIYSFHGILLIIISFLYEKYSWISIFYFFGFIIQFLFLFCFFIWFIIGNYLVFHMKNDVQYTNTYDIHTYCNYSLYQTAFWTTIVYYIILIVFLVCFFIQNIKWLIEQMKKLHSKTSNDDFCKV